MRKSKIIPMLSLLCVVLIVSTSTACRSKSKKEAEKQKLNIYIDIKDRNSLDLIRTILDEYKKQKSTVEVSMNSPLGNEKLEEDIVKGSIDMIFVPRNKMLELNKKGLLNDMGQFYTKNKISDKYYNILGAYGRSGDKYYGIALMPYSIEVMYNTEALNKINLQAPNDFKDLMNVFKRLNSDGIKVPVLLSEGIDIRNVVTALTFSNKIDMDQIERTYGKDSSDYSKLNLQPIFDELNALVKQGSISENTFETASDGSIKRLTSGEIPIMVALSSVIKDMKSNESSSTGSKTSNSATGEAGKNTPPKNIEVLKNYNISDTKNNIPVIVNTVLSMPANTKNEEAINDLLDFIFSDSTQKKLAEMGYVTTNKSVNEKTWKSGPNKDIAEHLEKADSNSIFYLYEFPDKFQAYLESATINILKGKYNGNEWKEVVSKISK